MESNQILRVKALDAARDIRPADHTRLYSLIWNAQQIYFWLFMGKMPPDEYVAEDINHYTEENAS
jgi:hypothetical protein